jgi:protein-S-isoprenylcysteine O-methyltransferase Ste14
VSCAIFTPSAFWFSRQEEDRLKTLLEDPSEYDRYRERVPALFPRVTRRSTA